MNLTHEKEQKEVDKKELAIKTFLKLYDEKKNGSIIIHFTNGRVPKFEEHVVH